MSDQKPVKRDAAWNTQFEDLTVKLIMAAEAFGARSGPLGKIGSASHALREHVTAPDPRDAVVDAAREFVKGNALSREEYQFAWEALKEAVVAFNRDEQQKPDPRDAELALCRDLLRSAVQFLPRFARLQAVSGVNSPELHDLIASIKQAIGDRT